MGCVCNYPVIHRACLCNYVVRLWQVHRRRDGMNPADDVCMGCIESISRPGKQWKCDTVLRMSGAGFLQKIHLGTANIALE